LAAVVVWGSWGVEKGKGDCTCRIWPGSQSRIDLWATRMAFGFARERLHKVVLNFQDARDGAEGMGFWVMLPAVSVCECFYKWTIVKWGVTSPFTQIPASIAMRGYYAK